MNDQKPEITPEVANSQAIQVSEPKKPSIEILWYPDPRLVANNAPITEYTPEMAEVVKEMFELMYKTNGLGLAAPQIGWNVQLFVMNLTPKDKTGEKVFWNPKISNSGDLVADIEGCLSFPTMTANIKRYEKTEMAAMTPQGPFTGEFVNMGARVIQHEIDHLEGLLFIDRMSYADQKKHSFIMKQLRYRIAAKKK